MKPGLTYALGIVVVVLALVILVQHRKLATVRNDNSSLRGDARALITTHNADAADLQGQIQKLRSENDQLRRELQQVRERVATNAPP